MRLDDGAPAAKQVATWKERGGTKFPPTVYRERPKVRGVEGVDFVISPGVIVDYELERHVYGTGDRVPMADAIKYGLVEEQT